MKGETMYLHKENRTILNISLDDSNGHTQMDSVAAYKLVDNYMKNTGLMYEIYHHTMSVRGGPSIMPFSALELILHDADDQKAETIKDDLKKYFGWNSPFDEMGLSN
jgi:hypothetical protein